MRNRSENNAVSAPEESSQLFGGIALLVSVAAAVVFFIPFAVNTSPWDAVTLRVPGDQGNWWHVLVGAPFLLAYPMIWLRLRARLSPQQPSSSASRLIWVFVVLSACGTVLVEVPFLLHRAGTSETQRLLVIFLGMGSLIAGAAIIFLRGRYLSRTRACLVGLDAAFLANAAACLVVYSEAMGSVRSRLGWFVTAVIIWPLILEFVWTFIMAGGYPGTDKSYP